MNEIILTHDERFRLIGLLNSIMGQAKFIRNVLFDNSSNVIIDLDLEIQNLKQFVKDLDK